MVGQIIFDLKKNPDIMDGLLAWADHDFTGRDLVIVVSSSNGRFTERVYEIKRGRRT